MQTLQTGRIGGQKLPKIIKNYDEAYSVHELNELSECNEFFLCSRIKRIKRIQRTPWVNNCQQQTTTTKGTLFVHELSELNKYNGQDLFTN